MNAREHSLRTIVADALEIQDEEERAAFLVEACGTDPALRSEDDAFLLGSDLLVVPQLTPERDRTPVLPKGIWNPVQLQWLTDLMGGYVWARYWHFLSMVMIVALSVIHIFMVFTVDPYAIKGITIGGYDETKSPEARNARPFYHLFKRSQSADPAAGDIP